jgi:hypothetical protein
MSDGRADDRAFVIGPTQGQVRVWVRSWGSSTPPRSTARKRLNLTAVAAPNRSGAEYYPAIYGIR